MYNVKVGNHRYTARVDGNISLPGPGPVLTPGIFLNKTSLPQSIVHPPPGNYHTRPFLTVRSDFQHLQPGLVREEVPF